MKRTLICVFAIFLLMNISITFAQDAPGCIQLSDIVADLVDAQTQAALDDINGALDTIAQVQDDLATIVELCTPHTTDNGPETLPNRYVAANRSLAFRYPEGWVASHPEPEIYFTGTSEELLDTVFSSDTPEFADGEMGAGLLVFDEESIEDFNLGDSMDYDALVHELIESASDEFGSVEQIRRPTLNDRRVTRFVFSEDNFSAVFDMIDFTSADNPAVYAWYGFSNRSDNPEMIEIFDNIVASFQAPARDESSTSSVDVVTTNVVDVQSLEYQPPVSIEPIVRELPPRPSIGLMNLSPNGEKIAWARRHDDGIEVCTVLVTGGDESCSLVEGTSLPMQLHWSPDSSSIAFVPETLRTFRGEPDVWVVDVETGEVRNLSDDGAEEFPFGAEDVSGTTWLDVAMTWANDGLIYVMRHISEGEWDIENIQSGIYQIDPADSTNTLVIDLTDVIEPFATVEFDVSSLQGQMAVSPDSTQLAFVARPRDFDDPSHGIWVVDLVNPSEAQQHVAYQDLSLVDHDLSNSDPLMTGVGWLNDSSGLLLSMADVAFAGAGWTTYSPLYYVDAERTLTPLVDFSDLERSDLFEIGANGYSKLLETPRAFVMSPDQMGVVMYSQDGSSNTERIAYWNPMSGPDDVTVLYTGEYEEPPYVLTTSISLDGTMLFGDRIIQPILEK